MPAIDLNSSPVSDAAADSQWEDACWNAVQGRNADMDDHFYFGVRTTGVYCRPSCPARRPLRANVRFFTNTKAAVEAGFRPCQRCKPDQASLADTRAALVAAACRQIDAADTPLSLADLAHGAGLSPHHFHRIFKAVTGLTPKRYADAARARRVQEQLRTGVAVTDAIFEAGFNSSGRFYAASDAVLGMLPSAYRQGGQGTAIQFALGECSLGSILVAATDKGVCAIALGDDPAQLLNDLQDRFPKAQLSSGDGAFMQWMATVIGLVENPAVGLDLPLDIRGSAFQQRVWQALRAIPIGSTASYSEVAARIGAAGAARAVAQACASNPVAIAIPCHRVVRSDGALSGYRWGIERKRALLEREGATGPLS